MDWLESIPPYYPSQDEPDMFFGEKIVKYSDKCYLIASGMREEDIQEIHDDIDHSSLFFIP